MHSYFFHIPLLDEEKSELYQFENFKEKVSLFIETDGLILKTAHNLSELREVFKLRSGVFLGDDTKVKFEYDKFDHKCDHMIVIDKASRQVVATYRLLSSHFVDSFYSETEFNLSDVLRERGQKNYLELGRASVHKDFRKSTLIDLLWKGIGLYAQKLSIDYAFGVSSVMGIEPEKAVALANYFKARYDDNRFKIAPKKKYKINLDLVSQHAPEKGVENSIEGLISPLLRTYIHAGANIYGEPAHDKAFKCFDYFTFLDFQKMHSSFKKRYFNQFSFSSELI